MTNTLIKDTYALATPAGRLPGTQGHQNAINYIQSRFAQIGLGYYGGTEGYRHSYRLAQPLPDRNATHGHNLVGVVAGEDRSLDPIVIGAHFDSAIDSYSADDNATAVAAMLHVARRLVDTPLQRDVVICSFDLEEPPAFHSPSMGSTRLYEDHMHNDAPHLAIIMDLIGHPSPFPGVHPHLTAVTGIESHPNLGNILHSTDLPIIAVQNKRVGDMSDHHIFRMNKHPYLFLSSGEWADYHTDGDTPDKIDYEKVAAVAAEVERMARAADTLTLGDSQHHDIRALELATAMEHLGTDLVEALGGTPDKIVPTMRQMMRTAA